MNATASAATPADALPAAALRPPSPDREDTPMSETSTTATATAPAPELTERQTASALTLLARAVGGPRAWAGKGARLGRTLRLYVDGREVRRRLGRLQALGHVEQVPTRLQMTVGGLDMVRFVIAPAAEDYYGTRGINFTFHQVLRFLDDPVSVIDPVGLLSDRDTIIGHLMQVTHLNPVYDLQLLEMFEDGLDELESQLEQMLGGSHPRAGTIGAIVEDPTYHGRLLDYVRRFRVDPGTAHLTREDGGIRQDPYFRLAERTFAALPSFVRYANRLPRGLGAAIRHLRADEHIVPDHCDPDVVTDVRAETGAELSR